MPVPRYSLEETARRGKEWYEQDIRAHIEAGNEGKIVVINVETGDFEVDDEHLPAARRALAKDPEAQLYALRVGYPALAKMGGSWAAAKL